MNPAVLQFVIEPLGRCRGLDDFASSTLTEPTIRDLEVLGRAALEDSRDLRKARPLVLNPRFHLSVDLGGADADLIARRRLIDWKATAATGIVGRTELWQLAGYALADTEDEYRIGEVGIAALRWRSQVSWGLDDFLSGLAPGPPTSLGLVGGGRIDHEPVDVPALRRDFADVVRRLPRRSRPAPRGDRGEASGGGGRVPPRPRRRA